MRARLTLVLVAISSGCLGAILSGCFRSAGPEPMPDAGPVVRGRHPESAGGDAGPFAFPADGGGKLLAELLVPADPIKARSRRMAARSRHARPPRGVERPELALEVGLPLLPRAPLASRSAVVRPRPLADEPVPREGLTGTLPESPRLPTGVRVRLSSPDPARPAPLPPLAQAHPDRAPLDDPTTEVLLAAALADRPPMRVTPAPFLRLVLPDPFENRTVSQARTALPEGTDPPPATPRRPGR